MNTPPVPPPPPGKRTAVAPGVRALLPKGIGPFLAEDANSSTRPLDDFLTLDCCQSIAADPRTGVLWLLCRGVSTLTLVRLKAEEKAFLRDDERRQILWRETARLRLDMPYVAQCIAVDAASGAAIVECSVFVQQGEGPGEHRFPDGANRVYLRVDTREDNTLVIAQEIRCRIPVQVAYDNSESRDVRYGGDSARLFLKPDPNISNTAYQLVHLDTRTFKLTTTECVRETGVPAVLRCGTAVDGCVLMGNSADNLSGLRECYLPEIPHNVAGAGVLSTGTAMPIRAGKEWPQTLSLGRGATMALKDTRYITHLERDFYALANDEGLCVVRRHREHTGQYAGGYAAHRAPTFETLNPPSVSSRAIIEHAVTRVSVLASWNVGCKTDMITRAPHWLPRHGLWVHIMNNWDCLEFTHSSRLLAVPLRCAWSRDMHATADTTVEFRGAVRALLALRTCAAAVVAPSERPSDREQLSSVEGERAVESTVASEGWSSLPLELFEAIVAALWDAWSVEFALW